MYFKSKHTYNIGSLYVLRHVEETGTSHSSYERDYGVQWIRRPTCVWRMVSDRLEGCAAASRRDCERGASAKTRSLGNSIQQILRLQLPRSDSLTQLSLQSHVARCLLIISGQYVLALTASGSKQCLMTVQLGAGEFGRSMRRYFYLRSYSGGSKIQEAFCLSTK